MPASRNAGIEYLVESIDADSGRFGILVKRPCSTDAVPRIFFMGHFAFAFVAFHETGNEQFLRHRVKFDTASLSVADNLVVVAEFDSFDDGPRLWSVIGDFVVVRRIERLTTIRVFP
jgi:hypothetical protein